VIVVRHPRKKNSNIEFETHRSFVYASGYTKHSLATQSHKKGVDLMGRVVGGDSKYTKKSAKNEKSGCES
jgi:hypothetical protein